MLERRIGWRATWGRQRMAMAAFVFLLSACQHAAATARDAAEYRDRLEPLITERFHPPKNGHLVQAERGFCTQIPVAHRSQLH